MTASVLQVGIAGCGRAARVHLHRLLGLPGVRLVGCADPDEQAARQLATLATTLDGASSGVVCTDHRELLREARPDVLAIFTPHLAHYRPAMDALQAGCHVFIEKPLSTNLQEAVDIVNLARGRGRKVGVGHQFRLCPSLVKARDLIHDGAMGPLRLITATMARPWLSAQGDEAHSWRLDRRASGGVLPDAGDHLLDALLWTTGRAATEVAAVQARSETGLDVVTAAAIRLSDGTPVTLAVSGVTPGDLFELSYFGDNGWIRATDRGLEAHGDGTDGPIPLGAPTESESIDGNFVAAIRTGAPLCCSAEDALDTVRLLEAIGRSVATAQLVRLA